MRVLYLHDMVFQEDGYDFEVNGKIEKFYGTLAVVSADNLGSLALGGFKESCTAYRCCVTVWPLKRQLELW